MSTSDAEIATAAPDLTAAPALPSESPVARAASRSAAPSEGARPPPFDPSATPAVDAALTSRRSLRAFLPDPVPRETLEAIFEVASRAPSGTNTQPWKVHVLTGAAKDRLATAVVAAYDDPAQRDEHREEYPYYPTVWKSPFIDRRRTVGWGLYRLLGIAKTDKAGMHAQHRRNFQFFGAPVGLIFTIDRTMQQGSWLDYGMFLQSVMVAARARGLDTCPQAAWNQFHRIIAAQLELPADEQVVCGMSLGQADPDAVENTLVTEREPVSAFVRFLS